MVPIKRLFDLVVAIIAVILTAPVLVGVALLIKYSDNGPVMFRQQRIGKNCREFTIYKFRTMVIDAEQRGGHSTMQHDPRITSIGRILRATSIDELPQLFNVIRGDMSIVGPRPDVPAQQPGYSPDDWTSRHSVRPGITGLAQATLRSSATPVERLRLDLEYVKRPTIGHDMKIIMATVRQVLVKGGN